MFLIRQSKPEDVSTLVKLARTVYFINLPPSEQIIASKVDLSSQCFRRLAGTMDHNAKGAKRPRKPADNLTGYDAMSDLFMLSIVDTDGGGVVGTSQIRAHMGGPGNPNWSLRVSERRFHSPRLGFGTSHTVVQLHGDESGPSEIGGLILDPGFRGHKLRPGRFLSFVRFHLVGLHRRQFAERILAEMMGPATSDGDNAFWDAFGRKFIPVKYAEADRFCQHNRQFITELLPKEEIYLTLLPLEVINSVGVVSRDTIPAKRLLESIGFKYRGFIDPFDGGPHLDAHCDEIPIVAQTRYATLAGPAAPGAATASAIVSHLTPNGEFRATESWIELGKGNDVRLRREAIDLLQIEPGSKVGVTILGKFGIPAPELEQLASDERDAGDAEAAPKPKKPARKAAPARRRQSV